MTSYEIVVSANESWQPVEGAVVRAGDTATVRFQQGEWTVDQQTTPMTVPAGHGTEADRTLTRLANMADALVPAVEEANTFKAAGTAWSSSASTTARAASTTTRARAERSSR
ncbi:hypothetical protein ABZY14_29945 [Streptomyces sp. NPDC006617]|uniref:hypothetical protein n=1 Tax=Streptomyces sp. NPDC006617 TaxID=3155354 RepID=UPI0033AE155E